MNSVGALMGRIVDFIIQPLIVVIFAFAFIIFLWGGVEFIFSAESDDGREKGKRHLLWGIIGMFIMVSVIGILRVLGNTFGFFLPV